MASGVRPIRHVARLVELKCLTVEQMAVTATCETSSNVEGQRQANRS